MNHFEFDPEPEDVDAFMDVVGSIVAAIFIAIGGFIALFL